MTWFDLVALVLVALAVLDGARTGLAWAVVELLFFATAAAMTSLVRPLAEPYVEKFAILSVADRQWVTHAGTFALLACMLMGVAYLLHPLVKGLRFKHDKWAGGAVGAITGVLAAMVLFSIAVWHSPRPYESQLRGSVVARLLAGTHDAGFRNFFPGGIESRLPDLVNR